MSKSQAWQNFAHQPSSCQDEEKPTFLFGALARSQLVDPIEGDCHFENVAISMGEMFARYAQKTKVVQNRTGLMTVTGDRDGLANATVLVFERKNQAPGANCDERTKITLQGASAPAMQTMSASN